MVGLICIDLRIYGVVFMDGFGVDCYCVGFCYGLCCAA